MVVFTFVRFDYFILFSSCFKLFMVCRDGWHGSAVFSWKLCMFFILEGLEVKMVHLGQHPSERSSYRNSVSSISFGTWSFGLVGPLIHVPRLLGEFWVIGWKQKFLRVDFSLMTSFGNKTFGQDDLILMF